MAIEVRPAAEDDRERIAWLVAEAFVLSARPATEPEDLDLNGHYVLTVDSKVESTARAIVVGQWFGGRQVPSAAVRAVAVSSMARGAGHGTRIMEALLMELRAEGTPLSILFPSVPSAYRRVGYELAGTFQQAASRADLFPRVSTEAEVVEVGLDDLDEVVACYDAVCRSSRCNGPIARDAAWWRAGPWSDGPARRFRIAIREAGRLTGYLVFSKEPSGAHLDYFHDVLVHDVAWLTPTAGDALAGYLAGQRGLAEKVVWPTYPGDPWTLAIGPRAVDTHFAFPFMERIVDVRSALEQRGYALGAAVSLDLSIADGVLDDATIHLEIRDGKAAVDDGRAASTRLDVGALSALYTGHASAHVLAKAGRVTAAREADLDALDVAFAGSAPFATELF